jgi:2-oxoisovalerate dehydrogenase E1 component alpha subunit
VLLELMTYRIGHHSTSDDSSRYRPDAEVQEWREKHHPIQRLRQYLTVRQWWTDEDENSLKKQTRQEVLSALKNAEAAPKPPVDELFTDVYDQLPPHLARQQQELRAHLAKHGAAYDLSHFASK